MPYAKSQTVRLLDVFVFGPVMIWAGYALRKERPLLAWSVGLIGVGTILYNGRNYLLVAEGRAK